ncbi:MAG: SDR family oxidoreductase, partial [Proteobacteria bacterium]|nr:SDR family oxidoreductase [Pseudomonadota bacterium]
MTQLEKVQKQSALVTGTSSGIGRAIADRLLESGWNVVGVDGAAPTIAHADFSHIAADLTNHDRLKDALAGSGPFRAFVHAAGFMRTGKLGELSVEDGAGMWRVHVEAATTLANIVVPGMPNEGRIVLIGSRTASGAAGRSQYAASKSALIGLARSWAIKLVQRGITVNVVAPAATNTPLLNDPARARTAPVLPPIGRYIEPSEIA